MKSDWTHLEQFRNRTGLMGSTTNHTHGAFFIPRGRTMLTIIASAGDESTGITWEHVSVRAEDYKGSRCPIWAEMCFVKDLFWNEEECVVQYHPARSEYVNQHPHVLHLWKQPLGTELPRPPKIAVGI